METDEIPPFMTPAGAAAILGISPITVQTQITAGRLKAIRTPGAKRLWTILREDLLEYKERTQPDGVPREGRPRSN